MFVFLEEALRDAGIDPKSGQKFTVKLTGVSRSRGRDGKFPHLSSSSPRRLCRCTFRFQVSNYVGMLDAVRLAPQRFLCVQREHSRKDGDHHHVVTSGSADTTVESASKQTAAVAVPWPLQQSNEEARYRMRRHNSVTENTIEAEQYNHQHQH